MMRRTGPTMTRRIALHRFITLVVISGVCTAAARADERPNVVLVMADDQGWGQVGYMGHPYLKGKTPYLDAMAESGIRFNRFYAAAPVCSPTRASVMTPGANERNPISMNRNDEPQMSAMATSKPQSPEVKAWMFVPLAVAGRDDRGIVLGEVTPSS